MFKSISKSEVLAAVGCVMGIIMIGMIGATVLFWFATSEDFLRYAF